MTNQSLDVTYQRVCDAPGVVGEVELLAAMIGGINAWSTAETILREHGDRLGCMDETDLMAIEGIGIEKAAAFVAAREFGRRLTRPRIDKRKRIMNPAEAAEILIPEMSLLEKEELRVLLLNADNRLMRIETVATGTVDSANLRIAEIFRPGVRWNAVSIMLAHNHPSGSSAPSSTDIGLTREICTAGRIFGIHLLDHLIIAAGRYVSMRELGIGFEPNPLLGGRWAHA